MRGCSHRSRVLVAEKTVFLTQENPGPWFGRRSNSWRPLEFGMASRAFPCFDDSRANRARPAPVSLRVIGRTSIDRSQRRYQSWPFLGDRPVVRVGVCNNTGRVAEPTIDHRILATRPVIRSWRWVVTDSNFPTKASGGGTSWPSVGSAGLGQRQGDNLLIPFRTALPTLNRSQLPALIVLADPEPEDRLGRLIQKYPESLIVACDGADQRHLRTLGSLGLATAATFGTAAGATAGGGGRRDGEKIGRSRVLRVIGRTGWPTQRIGAQRPLRCRRDRCRWRDDDLHRRGGICRRRDLRAIGAIGVQRTAGNG